MVVELAPPLSVAFACIDDFHGRSANKQTCEIKEKTWLPNGMGDAIDEVAGRCKRVLLIR